MERRNLSVELRGRKLYCVVSQQQHIASREYCWHRRDFASYAYFVGIPRITKKASTGTAPANAAALLTLLLGLVPAMLSFTGLRRLASGSASNTVRVALPSKPTQLHKVTKKKMLTSQTQSRSLSTSNFALAGHSHWNNIQHHKGKKDIARAQQFAKIAREIAMMVKMEKNANPAENTKLAAVLAKARGMGFPKEKIEASIDKGLGRNQGSVDYSSYELHGPLKVAFVVETASDNKNRIVATLRSWATRRGGSLAANGTFKSLFVKKGVVEVKMNDKSEDEVMEAAITAGAEDVSFEDGVAILECKPEEELVYQIRSTLEAANLEVTTAEVQLQPTSTVEISGEEDLETFQTSITALTEIDGVDSYVHNAILDLPDLEEE